MTRAVIGFCGERNPLRQREPAARGAAVGPRNFGRRIAVGDDLDEARLHLRAVALDVAPNQEVRRRHLVSPGPCVQVRPGAGHRDPALRTADRVVALAERREAVVAVGGDLRHRQRRGPFCSSAPRSASVSAFFLRSSSSGLSTRSTCAPGTLAALQHLRDEQLVAGRPLVLGLRHARWTTFSGNCCLICSSCSLSRYGCSMLLDRRLERPRPCRRSPRSSRGRPPPRRAAPAAPPSRRSRRSTPRARSSPSGEIGSNLWLWQRAQLTVRPSVPLPIVPMISSR